MRFSPKTQNNFTFYQTNIPTFEKNIPTFEVKQKFIHKNDSNENAQIKNKIKIVKHRN